MKSINQNDENWTEQSASKAREGKSREAWIEMKWLIIIDEKKIDYHSADFHSSTAFVKKWVKRSLESFLDPKKPRVKKKHLNQAQIKYDCKCKTEMKMDTAPNTWNKQSKEQRKVPVSWLSHKEI
jgi:hypothetical protein